MFIWKYPNDLKQTFDAKKNQKEEYDNEWWKATFDYISQNAEYKNEIINSQPKLERSQRIRKANPKYFILDYVQWNSISTKLVLGIMCIEFLSRLRTL